MTAPRVTLVGPVHPYRGGISSHTARLATELEETQVSVAVESWRSQYPTFLRGGARSAIDSEPELQQPARVTERLTWYNPISWWLAGRRARGGSLWVSYVTPYQVPFYFVMRCAFGSGASGVILHNVLPHERGWLDRMLLRLLLLGYRDLICHDERGAELLRSLRVAEPRIHPLRLPAALLVPPKSRASANFRGFRPADSEHPRLLFFGFVRQYKGLDVLYEALQANPLAELWVAGDFWEPREKFDQLALQLGIENRVKVFAGYIAKTEVPDLFACCDALILPYRSGTGSALRELGHSQGLPVIATDVGAIAAGIQPGVNGFVVAAGDADSLAAAIRALPTLKLADLRASAPELEAARNQQLWREYARQIAHIDK